MELIDAIRVVQSGGIIAYPTEAVYGLGCDPFNKTAVERLLAIKQRPMQKGLIMLVNSWRQVEQLVADVAEPLLKPVRASWPGPITWVFPARAAVPAWLTGMHDTIALRMTDASVAKALLDALEQPLISTSANLAGQEPLRDYAAVQATFGEHIDGIIPGKVGGLPKPTTMKDVVTGVTLR